MSVPSWARVGAKVECVDTMFCRLSAKTIYIISGICQEDGVDRYLSVEGDFNSEDGSPGLWLIRRFRPVVSISQADDLEAHFNQHLSADRKTEVPA